MEIRKRKKKNSEEETDEKGGKEREIKKEKNKRKKVFAARCYVDATVGSFRIGIFVITHGNVA